MKRFVNSVRNLADPASFWRQYYRRKQAGHDRDELRVPLRGGLTAIVPGALMSAFDEVFLREVYGAALRAVRGPAPVIIDVGANAGFFCLQTFARHAGARMIACEPLPNHVALIGRQMALNPGLALTIDARPVCGDRKTVEMRFDSRREYSVDASLFPVAGADASFEVEATTLADLYHRYAITRCDLLKLDCEGAEYEILYRCPDRLFAATDGIVLEVHHGIAGSGTVPELVAFLRGRGYRITNRKDEIVTCTRFA